MVNTNNPMMEVDVILNSTHYICNTIYILNLIYHFVIPKASNIRLCISLWVKIVLYS